MVTMLLLLQCPLDYGPDVVEYLDRQAILGDARADGWGVLPIEPLRAKIVANLIEDVGTELWHLSGLAATDTSFRHPEYPILVPLRNYDGQVLALQQLRLVHESEEEHIVAAPEGPQLPFGVERLAPHSNKAIVLCENPLEVLAYRAFRRKLDNDRQIVLGVPGSPRTPAKWHTLARERRVTIAFNNGDASESAAEELSKALYAAGAAHVDRERPGEYKNWIDVLNNDTST